MINLAIVDDDIVFTDMLKKKLLDMDNNLNISCYVKPYEFIANINNIDYVLLDIDLPQIDGISLSKQLRNNDISIFFITVHREKMIQAFGRNVEGFILKDNIEEGIMNLLNSMYKFNEQKYIIIQNQYGEIKLNLREIMYINYSLRDIEYYLTNNKMILQKNTNLKDVEETLNNDFVQINRNIIVNIYYITKLINDYVYIRDNKFKVSRRKRKNVKIKIFERDFIDNGIPI